MKFWVPPRKADDGGGVAPAFAVSVPPPVGSNGFEPGFEFGIAPGRELGEKEEGESLAGSELVFGVVLESTIDPLVVLEAVPLGLAPGNEPPEEPGVNVLFGLNPPELPPSFAAVLKLGTELGGEVDGGPNEGGLVDGGEVDGGPFFVASLMSFF